MTAGADPQLGSPGADLQGGEHLGIGVVHRRKRREVLLADQDRRPRGARAGQLRVDLATEGGGDGPGAPAVVGAGRRRSEIRGAGQPNQQDQGEGGHDEEEETGAAAAEEASLPGSTPPGWRAQRILKKRKKLAPATTAHTTIAKIIHSAKDEPPPVWRGTSPRLALVSGMLAWVCWGSMESE